MYLLLIRHGESEADLLDVHEGRADFNLTEKGHRQAIAMAKFVKENYAINKIYASPLKRATQTAQHLAQEYGLEIEFDPDLMEFNNGLLAGLTRKEADEKYPKIKDLPIDQAVYGQESLLEFRKRADKALERILANSQKNETIAVVSHGGMINQLYYSFLQMPVVNIQAFPTSDTGIHVWKIEENSRRVIKANMSFHTKGIE